MKRRERQHGSSQFEKTGLPARISWSRKADSFIVNLDAYLDSGLFLDHRITRAKVRDRGYGKRFLNLFAYTGSFYAAAGGARESVSVDLSNTYQDWTRRNFELNQMELAAHRLVRADVFRYLDEAARLGYKFGLIVLDPPSFSNSKKMQDVLDVQRDHPRLIRQSMALLDRGGDLLFHQFAQFRAR